MNYIDNVTIDGFWGDKTVEIRFGNEENFLIGVNGSGKTTVINLIAAAIEADFYTLDRIEFGKISIGLILNNAKRSKSRIIVQKVENNKTPYQNILYKIYKGSKKILEIFLDDLEEDRVFRYRDYERRYSLQSHRVHRKDLQVQLRKLFNSSWLSIHRYRTNIRRREEISHESLIDRKLDEFDKSFSEYIGELQVKAKEETDKFQKYIFLSLLTTETKTKLFQTLEKIDIKKEKKSLANVYSLFKLKKSEYSDNLDDYADSFRIAMENMEKNTIGIKDAEFLIGMKRIHSIIQEWEKLVSKQNDIYQFRNNFLRVINSLLQRKELSIDERNKLIVLSQSGKSFPLRNLSSGEKQLLIIFGETLLQKSQPHIFIADEPELSLHIAWQEKLVKSLKLLNPFAQMIFATHSPDIVSSFENSVIKIENHIK